MPTQQELDDAGVDALALTEFMTGTAGTSNVNSAGADIGTLADWTLTGGIPHFDDVPSLLADTGSYAVGDRLIAQRENAMYTVVDAVTTAHLITAGGVRLVHPDGPYLIAITGQSNAAGANADGPNPASPLVQIWDGVDVAWGSSDRTANPMARANPHGSLGNNNYGLARAHRVAKDTGRPVFMVFDALGGQAIDQWVGTGVTSPRYAALTTKIAAALGTQVMLDAGKSRLDEVILSQGEADFNDTFDVYLGKLDQLRTQLRSESWCNAETPIYMMSPSDLHDRYQWRDAMSHLCSQIDNRCIFVTSNGLRTEYSQTGSGDHTHFYGESLWEGGFTRIAVAVGGETSPTFFYGRGTGPADATDETAMSTFSTMVSRDSWTTEVPPNGPAATGAMSWGFECAAEGNYTAAFGYQTTTDNLANYGLLAGRVLTADSSTDYFGGFGYQNTLSARYTLVAGRGHTVTDEGGTAIGMFSEYTTAQTDHVMLQIGTGSSSSNRSNALTVRKSGQVEMKSLPVHADNGAATGAGLIAGSLYATATGELRVVV